MGSNEFGSTRNPMLWVYPGDIGVIAGRLLDPDGRPWKRGLSLISDEGGCGDYMELPDDPLHYINSDERLG
ncbi:MAG: hypothetical protein R3E31_02055 [Chloroflexota bacterium]